MNNSIKRNIIIIAIIVLSVILGTSITYAKGNLTSIYNQADSDNYSTVNNELAEDDDKTDNYLQSLTIEGYELYPEFNKNTTTYSVIIPKTVNSLNIIAIPESEDATTKITGNTNLTKKENTINIVVKAQNKKTKTYKIIVNKQEDNGLKLLNLNIENATLSPKFNSEHYNYTAEIKTTTDYTDLNINAEANNPDAEIEVIGSTNLDIGEHLISIILKNKNIVTTYEILANITKNDEITTMSEENENFFKVVQNKINEFFSDSTKVIIVLSIIAILLLILTIIIIIKVIKNKKANENREKLKNRAK